MKKTKLFLCGIFLIVAMSACSSETHEASHDAEANTSQKSENPQKADAHGHGASAGAEQVPAFERDPKDLSPTLDPELFMGKTRQAYMAVREIPRTIAQLPCYCHCDENFGHKSLHTCYVDDHAAMCAVCVEEVLLAYRLEKQEGLTPEQIRERIIAKYSH